MALLVREGVSEEEPEGLLLLDVETLSDPDGLAELELVIEGLADVVDVAEEDDEAVEDAEADLLWEAEVVELPVDEVVSEGDAVVLLLLDVEGVVVSL